jgi:hypothetical protein
MYCLGFVGFPKFRGQSSSNFEKCFATILSDMSSLSFPFLSLSWSLTISI